MMEVKAKLKNLNIGMNYCEFKKDESVMNLSNEFSKICPLEVIGDQERIK